MRLRLAGFSVFRLLNMVILCGARQLHAWFSAKSATMPSFSCHWPHWTEVFLLLATFTWNHRWQLLIFADGLVELYKVSTFFFVIIRVIAQLLLKKLTKKFRLQPPMLR